VLELKRLELQLNASLQTERALREEQADFLRIVGHEFRTPLAVIRNAVDMIRLIGDKSKGATNERLAGIGEALDRLFSLIKRLMTNGSDNFFRPEPMQIASLMPTPNLIST